MAIKITKGNDPILTKNLIVVLFGQPGAGKTSLAFSTDKPLLLDFDNGAKRSIGRKDAVLIESWNDISNLTEEDLRHYNTIIIDTIGRCLDLLGVELGKRDSKLVRRTGELTMQGYGALFTAFKSWIETIKSFGKDIVLIAHKKDEKRGEDTYFSLDAKGSSKEEIFKIADLLGYVSIISGKRMLDFNPTEDHVGKNCASFEELKITSYSENQHYLSDIIEEAKRRMNNMSEEQTKEQQSYNQALVMIDDASTVDDFNGLLGVEYILGHKALKTHLHKSALSKGFEFNTETKSYMVKE